MHVNNMLCQYRSMIYEDEAVEDCRQLQILLIHPVIAGIREVHDLGS